MSDKEISFREDARNKIKSGIDETAEAVRVTIGPYGRNVALEKKYGGPTITNDGVSIAKEISFKDKYKTMGAELVKEVAQKTNDIAGDGTSTSIVIFSELVNEGLKNIERGVNSLSVRRGMERAYREAIQQLDKVKQEVRTDKEIINVAKVAVEDDVIGEKIADMVKKVGKNGVVTVEESRTFGIETDVVEGLEIDNGYVSPYMITNTDRMEADYKDVSVLITDKKLSSVKEFLPFFEKVLQSGIKNIFVVAEDIDGEALTTFVLNKLKGTFNVLAVKSPGYGDRKKDILDDIAVSCGATVISDTTGITFDKADISMLGSASRIISKKDSTIIVGGKEREKEIEERVSMLQGQVSNTESSFEKEKLEERIAKLSGGVGVIRVGAATEAEMKYLKLKIEDSINATKAAIDEGIIPGGGSAFAHIAKYLKEEGKKKIDDWGDQYEEKGYLIVAQALEAPLRQIADNAIGDGEGVSIVRAVQSAGEMSGYNALGDKSNSDKNIVENMFEKGIIDPLKVARAGLKNAVSSASIFLTTEAAIVELEDEDKGSPGAMMPPTGMPY